MTDQPDWVHPSVPSDSRVIVSAGVGAQHYRKLLRSTENHCAVHCPDTWRLFYDVLPEGCEPHVQRPYKFKITALQKPIEAGYRYVVWMDATFQPIASIEPLWAHIKERGWYCARQGDANLGAWTSSAALSVMGINRDKAMKIPLVFSGLLGLDMWSAPGRHIWGLWKEAEEQGIFFGPHVNAPGSSPISEHGLKWRGHCAYDPRCEGHRHDESALSFILWKLGLEAPAADWAALGLGRHVPDYDVVAMRAYIKGHGVLGWDEAARACGDL